MASTWGGDYIVHPSPGYSFINPSTPHLFRHFLALPISFLHCLSHPSFFLSYTLFSFFFLPFLLLLLFPSSFSLFLFFPLILFVPLFYKLFPRERFWVGGAPTWPTPWLRHCIQVHRYNRNIAILFIINCSYLFINIVSL